MGGDNFQERVNPVPKKIPTENVPLVDDMGNVVLDEWGYTVYIAVGAVGEHYYGDPLPPGA